MSSASANDRVVLVTGAASGIGRATVERVVAQGCRVVAVDRDDRFGWVAIPVDGGITANTGQFMPRNARA